MKKKVIRGGAKAILFSMCFLALFRLFLVILVPQSKESFGITKGFYALEDNSLEALFLGSSQMFCAVNSKKLTDEFGIPSYDFGGPYQLLPITSFYLQEALKTQRPKVVMVEVCQIFLENEKEAGPEKGNIIAWNYFYLKNSTTKLDALKEMLEGETDEAVKYMIFPLLEYHSLWKSIAGIDLDVSDKFNMAGNRGYSRRDDITPVELAYLQDDAGEENEIPETVDRAITRIAELCREQNLEIVFFKSPSSTWTKNNAKIVKAYMAEHGYPYLELNDDLEQIGIDSNVDFYDGIHLNVSGANKTTDFIAQYLMDNYQLGYQAVR